MTTIEQRTMTVQMQVTFRFAERSDLPKLEWGGEHTHFRRVFQRAFEDQRAGTRLMLLANVNEYPIGQVFIQLESFDDFGFNKGRRGYLYSLRVMQPFQRRGIGTGLLQEAQQVLRERSYDSVSIAAAKDNPGARHLYEKMGFQVYAEDAGRWNYTDHEGRIRHVSEPCWLLEKNL